VRTVDEVDISAEICGMTFDPAIMNASGIFSFVPVLGRLQDSFGGLVTKSISYHERDGFKSPVFAQLSENEYINAVGLPNPGYKAMLEELREEYPLRKPLIVSVFGSEIGEMEEMVSGMERYCDGFEVNLSCPHPKPGEKVGRALGSDPNAVYDFVKAIKDSTGKPVIAKLSYSLENLVDSTRASVEGGADAISSTNTIGPTDPYSSRVGYPVLANSVGGLSGPGIKKKGLESVRRIREFDADIPIIGMGGITYPNDVIDYVRAGADAVAMGSAFDLMRTEDVAYTMELMKFHLKRDMMKAGARNLRELRD
jgi:dihydroorotate dehydrogenase (NAD+) catalytic subunit